MPRPPRPRLAPLSDPAGPPLRPGFWTLPLADLTRAEWEALCDGCGKCCLNKLEDEETGIVVFTRVACRLLDGRTCRCRSYPDRHAHVPECITLTPDGLADIAYWLPRTCAYRLRAEGKGLEPWHPLISGDPASVHRAGVSMAGRTVSEARVPEEDWEDFVIEDLS